MLKTPIIIDTDPGIDDAIALAIALYNEKLDVKLITTVAGNVGLDYVTENTLKLMKFFGKDVPIAKGANAPLLKEIIDASNVHGKTGMEGYDFEEPDNNLLLEDNAVNSMYKVIMESSEPMTVIGLGPLTNISLLFKVYPEVKENIKEIIFMGGSISRGNSGVMSEFNIDFDPEAAKVVFDSGVKYTMVGMNIGGKALVLPEDSEKIKVMNEVGDMIYSLFSKYRGGSLKTGLKMYDSTAIAYLLRPDMFETVETFADIELDGKYTRGATIIDLSGYLKRENNATVCLDIDHDEFRKWFLEEIDNCQ